MKLHWKVLIGMAAGVILGLALQLFVPAQPTTGLSLEAGDGALVVRGKAGPAAKSKLQPGDRVVALVVNRGGDDERRVPVATVEDFQRAIADRSLGEVVWAQVAGREEPIAVPVGMDPASVRAKVIAPFSFFADIFLALLKMLIVPLVLTSIVNGVASLGSASTLRRLGVKTFAYYVASSLLAILVGQLLVNVMQPGDGAALGLTPVAKGGVAPDVSFLDVLKRMVPTNVFESLGDNAAMLQIIFFALLFGYFVTRTPEPHGPRMRQFFESAFEVMMRLAEGVLSLIPYGVFALLVGIVAGTGVEVFKPLLLYMATVTLALLVHAGVTLPVLVKTFAGVSPLRWFKAMSPALITAFSTSSSSMTLPVTLETLEKRGKVSNQVASFTLPLGATINMDGTALYEAVGVIFLAQYYASQGGFELTLGSQALVVFLALLASIGTAAIPSAGLVMMLTILSALGLPLEGAALLLAVDRPLDMLRTTVNVWSDTCGAAVVARSEGEEQLLEAGMDAKGG